MKRDLETKMDEKKYTQLCVWQGVNMGDSTPAELEDFFMEKFGTRVKYKGEVTTLPDLNEDGSPDFSTGGRTDLFFYVHTDDIGKFAVQRLEIGIRWWEDVIKYNNNSHLYTPDFIAENPPTW